MICKNTSDLTSTNHQGGFTLIELLVTVSIIALVAMIAVPSYTKYVVTNAESGAMTEIKRLEIQLEKWKSSRLTYRGFMPNRGPNVCTGDDSDKEYCYDESDNITIYVPKGSDENNYVYKLEVVDLTLGTSLVEGDASIDITVGRGWRILATPNPDEVAEKGFIFMASSDGAQCKTKGTGIDKTSTDCGDHSTVGTW